MRRQRQGGIRNNVSHVGGATELKISEPHQVGLPLTFDYTISSSYWNGILESPLYLLEHQNDNHVLFIIYIS